MHFIAKAWKEVTAATIHHSFRHAGLCNSQIVETSQFDSEDNLPLSEWIKTFSIPVNFYGDLQAYEDIDENVVTTSSLTDEQIIDSVSKNADKFDEDEDQMDDYVAPPTIQQALDAAKLVENYLLFNLDDSTTYSTYQEMD